MEKIYFFLVLMFFQVGVFAQSIEQEKYQVHFKSGNYFPEKHYQLESSGKKGGKGARTTGKEYVLIQFYTLPDSEMHRKIKAAGIELLEFIPDYAYLASIPGTVDSVVLARLNVRSLEAVQPEHKTDPALFGDLAVWVEKEKGKADVVITAFKGYSLADLTNDVASIGGKVIKENSAGNMLEVRVSKNRISSLASLQGVAYVAPVSPPPVPLNYYSVTTGRVNVLRSATGAARNLRGEGVTIAVGDVFSGNIHADLQNRVANLATYTSDDLHGDHTSGTIAGAGNLDPLHAGIAPKASLVYTDMVDNINNASAYYTKQKVRITSNSYRGSLNGGVYDYNSRVIDQQASDGSYPDLLHIFAAANEGSGFRTVADSWSAAKNALVVGAVDHRNQIAYFSSRGPVKDGRIKPEVVASGVEVHSTAPVNSYSSLSGTSMATPAVAGIVSLLYERYKQLNNNDTPDAGLIKALICNTADDLGNQGPDFTYGFGQVNAGRAVEALEKKNWLTGRINAGESVTHTIAVPAGTARLRVMLYWKDKEAAENAAAALVNDLDLSVKSGGTTYLPWVLNTAPGKENSPAVRAVDRLNNIEQVTVDKPSGPYSFTINGEHLATGAQEYVVVYEIEEPEIAVTFPYAGESLVPGESVFIRWDHSVAGPFTVEYSADNGSTWKTVATNIAARQNFTEWQVPDVVTGQLLVRVSNGTVTGRSAGVSSIMKLPERMTAAALAGGKKQLKWKKVPGADSYEVFSLSPSDKEMQLITTVADTSVLLQNIPSDNYWFAVRPKNKQGATGRRTVAAKAVPYRQPENPASVAAGLNYTYYEGSWNSMPDFSKLQAVKTGVADKIQPVEIRQRNDNYGIRYTGFIKVPQDGIYTFHLYARTEAKFYVGDRQVALHAIDRDGEDFGTGTIALQAGMHKITYDFYERNAGRPSEFAYLLISGESISRREVQKTELFRELENQKPVVSLTSPAANEAFKAPATVTVKASASDADVTVRKVEFFSGTTKIGEDTSAPYAWSWANVAAGEYTLTAKATDDKGAVTTSAAVVIKVESASAGNQVPVVNAGSDKTLLLPQNSINLSGQAHDADGRFVSFRWEKVSGPSVSMKGQDSANVSLSNLEKGVYVFRFSATDNDGATGSDEMTLTVKGDAVANKAPQVNAGPDKTVTLPLDRLQLSATASDPDGSVVAYKWEKVSGPAVGMANAGTSTLTLSQLQEGSYIFKISVTDDKGAVAYDQLNLRVNPAPPSGNQIPVANAGRDKVIYLPTNSISLSGQAIDYDGRFVRFFWEKVSGPSVTISGQSANVKLTNLVEGVYVFRFSATDNDGATGTDEMTLTVKATGRSTSVASGGVTAYPNSFRDYVDVEIHIEETGRYDISVYDLLGRFIYQSQVVSESNDEGIIHRIDFSEKKLNDGIYIIRVENLNSNFRKIVRVVKGNN